MFYAYFLDNFGQSQGIYEQIVAKTRGKQGRGLCRGDVSFINDPFPRIFHQKLGAQRSTFQGVAEQVNKDYCLSPVLGSQAP